MIRLVVFILLASFSSSLYANNDIRNWTISGDKLKAELLSYREETGVVTLKLADFTDREFRFSDFSITDRDWLIEWVAFEKDLDKEIQKLGGVFEQRLVKDQHETELFVFYPSAYCKSDKKLAAMILFHPGGKTLRYLKRHIQAAEKTDLILIACGSFRNSGVKTPNPELEAEFKQRFLEVNTHIRKTIKADSSKIFIGGTSGGAARAFHYTAWFDGPWAGVYSNGGWLMGKEYYNEAYPANMKVAMVNGDSDKGANWYVKSDSKVLEDRDCVTRLIEFEGGHQIPPTRTQEEAFRWLLQSEQSNNLDFTTRVR